MPTKKKKFNARFPPARIKKIMQTDDEVGKVAAPVPVIISKALEMFMHTLVEKACLYTQSRNAKTLTTAHIKKCISSEQQFDFLKDLVEKIPDLPDNDEEADGEHKPKRRKQQPANKEKEKDRPKRKRKIKKEEERIVMSDDSEDDQEEEEPDTDEEASGSSESHSNHGNINTNNTLSTSVSNHAASTETVSKPPTPPVITVTKATDNDDIFQSLPSTFNNISSLGTCKSIEEEDDDYDS